MVRDPFADEAGPDLQAVLDALDDPDCREVVSVLSEPIGRPCAGHVSERCHSSTGQSVAVCMRMGNTIRVERTHV